MKTSELHEAVQNHKKKLTFFTARWCAHSPVRHLASVTSNWLSRQYQVFLGFSSVFLRFSLDFCKGRIFKNTPQMSLEAPKILPLPIFSVSTPAGY